MRHTGLRMFVAASALVVAAPVLAHTGVGDTNGFAHGFAHPLRGIDHVLAMVGAGIFAAHLGGRALWAVPLTFVSMMAVGGALGIAGVTTPFVGIGIGLSVLAFGLLIAFRLSVPVVAAMTLVGVFAIFHGQAHGAEMPETASGFLYGLGFLVATAILHALGIGTWLALELLSSSLGRRVAQVGGTLMSVAGFAIVTGIV